MSIIQKSNTLSSKYSQEIDKYREVKPLVLGPPELSDLNLKNANIDEITSGLETYTGEWNKRQARHLLSITLFGVKKEELDYFSNLSMEEAVDSILKESPLPEAPVNNYQGEREDALDPDVELGQSWIEAPHAGNKEGLRVVSLKTWLIENILKQESTIHEKLKLFWSNLLVTKVWDVYTAKASYKYWVMLHDYALGNYREFIRALTIDPSMLNFLNGTANTKNKPDENYGRELQELFCVGKGPNSAYTEEDVQSAARVLTGWTINWTTRNNEGPIESYFNPNRHDTSDKVFSAFYGNKVIEGKTGESGADELDEMLDMIFSNEETAKYICRRIYSFFVSNVITETVEQNVITPLADIFRLNNYEIRPVLEKLFKSEHFYDQLNRGSLIKSPADHLLGLWRTMEIHSPEPDDLILNYQIHRAMLWQMANMGMEMGDPPNVAGWAPYYQAPQYDKAWITTDTIIRRAKNTDSLIYWGFWISSTLKIKVDLPELIIGFNNPSDPNEMLSEAALLFLGLEISKETIDDLKTVLLSGQQSDYYWTSAWNAYIADPENSSKKQTVENRLKPVFKQLLQLGEYHLI